MPHHILTRSRTLCAHSSSKSLCRGATQYFVVQPPGEGGWCGILCVAHHLKLVRAGRAKIQKVTTRAEGEGVLLRWRANP